MARVIKLPTGHSPELWLQEVANLIDRETSVVVAIKRKDGSVVTACWECDAPTSMELAGHIQADAMMDMVRANVDELIEIING